MPKAKPGQFSGSKAKSKKNSKISAAETSDDVLATGVEFEEAGEKWRAGDAAKSCRFFVRALDAYEEGLKRFPTSFDLAYNKARLQFDLAQQPRLLQFLPSTSIDLLSASLESHRFALNLSGEDADTLFNTAQILVSLAEQATQESGEDNEALILLQEAAVLFDKCLAVQETRYQAAKDDVAAFQSLQNDAEVTDPRNEPVEESIQSQTTAAQSTEAWATVEEPITKTTLLDTCLAAIQCLATMVPLLAANATALQQFEQAGTALVHKAENLLQLDASDTSIEFFCTRAKFATALLLLSLRGGKITPDECARQIHIIFDFPGRDTAIDALSEYAEAIISFDRACAFVLSNSSYQDDKIGELLNLRWNQLTIALDHLSAATKLPPSHAPWTIHARKADIELSRVRLTDGAVYHEYAAQNKDTLLNNAEVYYRGAKNLANVAGEKDIESDMGARENVVKHLRQQSSPEAVLEETIVEMRAEGLLN